MEKPKIIPPAHATSDQESAPQPAVIEVGGPKGPEPTRYQDWEINGKCVDF